MVLSELLIQSSHLISGLRLTINNMLVLLVSNQLELLFLDSLTSRQAPEVVQCTCHQGDTQQGQCHIAEHRRCDTKENRSSSLANEVDWEDLVLEFSKFFSGQVFERKWRYNVGVHHTSAKGDGVEQDVNSGFDGHWQKDVAKLLV